MPEEVVRFLQPRAGGIYLDGTLGGAGHAALIAAYCTPDNGLLVGIDRDQAALEAASRRLAEYGDSIRLVHGNFADLGTHLDQLGISALDGFILDLGVS